MGVCELLLEVNTEEFKMKGEERKILGRREKKKLKNVIPLSFIFGIRKIRNMEIDLKTS